MECVLVWTVFSSFVVGEPVESGWFANRAFIPPLGSVDEEPRMRGTERGCATLFEAVMRVGTVVVVAAAVVEMGRPVQSCVEGEEVQEGVVEDGLWVRGDDGVDLPADDDSLGPSGRYM